MKKILISDTKNYTLRDYNTSKIESLLTLSSNGLQQMLISNQDGFYKTKTLKGDKLLRKGSSSRSNLINIIGLFKAQIYNYNINIDLNKILLTEIDKVPKFTSTGDIGLLLWATALIAPNLIDKIITKINLNNILTDYSDAKKGITVELSLLLIGILIAATFNKIFRNSIGHLPEQLYKIIRNNYGGAGIFRQKNISKYSNKKLYNVANLSDQVFAIYAFSLFSKIRKDKESLLVAKECALKLCENQEKDGSWNWQYDVTTGKQAGKYPIYSVYQYALIPMALFAIQRASNIDFESYIIKGLGCLDKQQTVNQNIVDYKNNLIWNAILPKKVFTIKNSVFRYLGIKTNLGSTKIFVDKKCNSMDLGWLLNALCGKTFNNSKPKHKPVNEKLMIYKFNTN